MGTLSYLVVFHSRPSLVGCQSSSVVLCRSSRCAENVEDLVAVRSDCSCLGSGRQSSWATPMGLRVSVFRGRYEAWFSPVPSYRTTCPCRLLCQRLTSANSVTLL